MPDGPPGDHRPNQPRGGRGPRRQRQNGGVPPAQHLHEARHQLPPAARRAAGHHHALRPWPTTLGSGLSAVVALRVRVPPAALSAPGVQDRGDGFDTVDESRAGRYKPRRLRRSPIQPRLERVAMIRSCVVPLWRWKPLGVTLGAGIPERPGPAPESAGRQAYQVCGQPCTSSNSGPSPPMTACRRTSPVSMYRLVNVSVNPAGRCGAPETEPGPSGGGQADGR